MTNPDNQKQGCLTSILRLFRIESPRSRTSSVDETRDIAEVLPYRTRDDFLSPTELSFYHVLDSIVGNRVVICPKVGLAEIFFVIRPNENQSYRNRIIQKHLDFLLCDPKSMRPILGIELNDSSHTRSDRKIRDEFVVKVFKAAKLPLLRGPAQYAYNTNQLSEQLDKYLGIQSDTPVHPADTSPSKAENVSPPFCSKCGVPMVVRTVARGEHQGKQFYGCPNYPKCRVILPLNTQARK